MADDKRQDIGTYNKDPGEYQRIIDRMYDENPAITLSSEYAHFITDNTLQLLVRLARYKFAVRLIKPTDTVLEVGSGAGIGAIFLGQHARSVTGLEIKQSEIDMAEAVNRRGNVSFLNQDFFQYHPAEPFDAIVSLDVIEHLDEALGERMVATAATLLCDTGMVIVGSPSIYSYPYQSPQSQASHVKCYDQKELVTMMDRYFGRTIAFSMNDEVVHTGFSKLAWYYFVVGFCPRHP